MHSQTEQKRTKKKEEKKKRDRQIEKQKWRIFQQQTQRVSHLRLNHIYISIYLPLDFTTD